MNARADDPVTFVASLQWQTSRAGKLGVWTIYNRPADFPDGHVARMHISDATGSRATAHVVTGEIELIRKVMRYAGLVCFARASTDDPTIVESWL